MPGGFFQHNTAHKQLLVIGFMWVRMYSLWKVLSGQMLCNILYRQTQVMRKTTNYIILKKGRPRYCTVLCTHYAGHALAFSKPVLG